MKKLLLAVVVSLLSGCATMYQGSTQEVTVLTRNDNSPNITQCKLINEEGHWETRANSTVRIHRDGNEMQVLCSNEAQAGEAHVSPEFSGGYVFLDFLLDFGIVSGTIDGLNNAFYNYQSSIDVNMGKRGR
jgi:uncharacterized protein YceK